MQNIEIKARVEDLDRAEAKARALGARWAWTRRQRDVFFRVPLGYLKLRSMDDAAAELIAYTRAPGGDPRPSDYVIAPVAEPSTLEAALSRSLGILGVVEKTRTLYLWRHTRIHLDRVDGLGSFLELETVMDGIDRAQAEAETREAMGCLALDPETLLAVPYLLLLERTGRGNLGG